jgi:hypothetical protein
MRAKQPRRVSGNIDSLTLAMQGRGSGLNAIITGEISEIKVVQEELGYLWFKEMVFFVHVHVMISVYDTETAAKLLEKYFSEEGEISKDAYYQMESRDITKALPVIENLLVSLSRQMADEACEKIEEEPFKTYLKSGGRERITVHAGKNVGIATGNLFTIHDAGRTISGNGGHTYIVCGPETGKLRIDKVYEDSAEGTIIEGDGKGTDLCLKLYEE